MSSMQVVDSLAVFVMMMVMVWDKHQEKRNYVSNGDVAVLNVIIISRREKKEGKKTYQRTRDASASRVPVPCSVLGNQSIPYQRAGPQHVGGGDVAIGVVLGVVDGRRNEGRKEQQHVE
jgi:hypothetical protein